MLREKYFDEQFPFYFVFGNYQNGNVDLTDGQRDVYENITPELATKIMHERNSMVSGLYKLLGKLDNKEAYDLMMDLKQDIQSIEEPEYYNGYVISENTDPSRTNKYHATLFNSTTSVICSDDVTVIKLHLDSIK